MTPQDQRRNEDEPKATAPSDSAEKKPSPAQVDPKKPAGLGYVFKFAPADPKNSFDFEDVADK